MSKEQFLLLIMPFKKYYLDSYKVELKERKVDVNIGYYIEQRRGTVIIYLTEFKIWINL
jgi:hypothetical protein